MVKAARPAPFDRLRRDKISGGYTQTLDHRGHRVEVRFEAENDQELADLLPIAMKFWKSRIRWFKAFREYAATELLSELNGCLDSGQQGFQPLTAAQVRRLLPAPFSVVFIRDPDSGEVSIEMNGGEDQKFLEENCFEVFATLEDGITSGQVVTLL